MVAEDSCCSVPQPLSNLVALDNKGTGGGAPGLKASLTMKSESFSELISSGALGNKAF